MRKDPLPILCPTGPGRHRGFTLLELMLVITVAAVILGLGIPNMTQFIRNNRMTSAANDMLAALYTARTEAVKRRAFTTFCFTDNPTADAPTCANAGRGWIVFVDDANPAAADANDANFVVNPNEAVLLRHDTLPTVFTSFKKAPAGTQGVTFLPSGFTRADTTPVTSTVFCDQRNNVAVYGAQNSAARALTLSATGRPRVMRAVSDITSAGDCP